MRVRVPPPAFFNKTGSPFPWTHHLAYVVGLITTDGSLSKDKRHIDFTSSDLRLVKTFKKCISLKNNIREKYGSFGGKTYHLQFGNVKFYNWLLGLGLMPNKTHRLGRLKIPKVYFRDFLRGHLDGDGSVITYKDNYMSYKGKRYNYDRIYLAFYSSSLKHIKWLKNEIKSFIDIKGSMAGWKHKDRKMTLWKLRLGKYDSLKVLSWIYYAPDLPCLARKRKIAQHFLKTYGTNLSG